MKQLHTAIEEVEKK